ncbi:MAG: type I-E CRISPR-associated protein Cse2/CasB [Desulfatitalea sp.]|nr:type I-E CRISPR-associated protein Cse2/CasB [Desulfatitalea sp.]
MAQRQPAPVQSLITAIDTWIAGEKNNTNPKARGILADLRHGLGVKTQYRAWPHLLAIHAEAFDDEQERAIWLTVAGGMALLMKGRDDKAGNMGATLKKIAQDRGDGGLATFDGRFRRLLSCRMPDEVCRLLTGVFRAAKQKETPIDFERLFNDLQDWNNPRRKIRIQWAKSFWAEAKQPEKGETR